MYVKIEKKGTNPWTCVARLQNSPIILKFLYTKKKVILLKIVTLKKEFQITSPSDGR
jgi:hypothetical protein